MSAIVVLGLGNLLFADEGFGVRCVEALHRRWDVRGADVLDGGTQGLNLVEFVAGAEHLVVFDCLDWGDPPGTLRILRGAEVPSVYATGKLSLHQAGFWDVLAAADLLGRPPKELVVIGNHTYRAREPWRMATAALWMLGRANDARDRFGERAPRRARSIRLPREVPPGDGGLALGQAWICARTLAP